MTIISVEQMAEACETIANEFDGLKWPQTIARLRAAAALLREMQAGEWVRVEPEEESRDPELDHIEPLDRTKLPRCPICWTNGHDHRKDCPNKDAGMSLHVWRNP